MKYIYLNNRSFTLYTLAMPLISSANIMPSFMDVQIGAHVAYCVDLLSNKVIILLINLKMRKCLLVFARAKYPD